MIIKESAENYLESILVIKNTKGFVRSIDIANELGYSKPSISRAVGILKNDGYITVEPNGQIILTDSGKAKAEQVYLPVMGSITMGDSTNHGFMALCKSGDTCASVNASVSDQNATGYNTCWFEFQVRTEDTYYMGNRKLTVFEAGEIKQPTLSVAYYPMADKELSYVDVAERYRQYLMEEKGLQEKKDKISYILMKIII